MRPVLRWYLPEDIDMLQQPPRWVVPVMRTGYAARGVVYTAVGGLALLAALQGGSTPDAKSAVATFLDEPMGEVVVGIIALGLICYALWRFLDALWDLDQKGSDWKGGAARAGQFISAATHFTLGMSIAVLALHRSDDAGGGASDHWTATLMSQPFGRWLVAIVGVIVIAIGVQQFIKAFSEKYRDELVYTSVVSRLSPLIKLGLLAHGAVILIVGGFFIWAAWTAEPSRAGGLRDALKMVREADGGQWLFAAIAAGLVCFAIYCFIAAVYRIVPRCSGGKLTLSGKARELRDAAARVARHVGH